MCSVEHSPEKFLDKVLVLKENSFNSPHLAVSLHDPETIYDVITSPRMKRSSSLHLKSDDAMPSPFTTFRGDINSDGSFYQAGISIDSEKNLDPYNQFRLRSPVGARHFIPSPHDTAVLFTISSYGETLHLRFDLGSLKQEVKEEGLLPQGTIISMKLSTYESFLAQMTFLADTVEQTLCSLYKRAGGDVNKEIIMDLPSYSKGEYLPAYYPAKRFLKKFKGFRIK